MLALAAFGKKASQVQGGESGDQSHITALHMGMDGRVCELFEWVGYGFVCVCVQGGRAAVALVQRMIGFLITTTPLKHTHTHTH